jgi:hypothetical protein
VSAPAIILRDVVAPFGTDFSTSNFSRLPPRLQRRAQENTALLADMISFLHGSHNFRHESYDHLLHDTVEPTAAHLISAHLSSGLSAVSYLSDELEVPSRKDFEKNHPDTNYGWAVPGSLEQILDAIAFDAWSACGHATGSYTRYDHEMPKNRMFQLQATANKWTTRAYLMPSDTLRSYGTCAFAAQAITDWRLEAWKYRGLAFCGRV